MSLSLAHSFAHGIHPDDHKDQTEHLPIERMPFSDRYVLPLSQHAGAASRPRVRVGQRIRRGERIADPAAFVSTALHSPVDGRVSAIAMRRHPNGNMMECIEVETDQFSTQEYTKDMVPAVDSMDRPAFIEHVQRAGLVGMGGAAFPTHVKYRLPEGRRCRNLVINGCECEPYLTCDHRVMVEHAQDVVRGIEIVAQQLGAESTSIGVEVNKLDAIQALQKAIPSNARIEVVALETKYPQGAEKLLIKALYGREVPAGKLPIDLDIVVNNIGTMVGIAEYFDRGKPLIERVVTVAGPGVARPANLMVPIGTSVHDILRYCDLTERTAQVIMGGPMMGQALSALDVPILKGTSGLLAFTDQDVLHPNEYACVRCGRCLEACGQFLNPQRLARLAKAGRYEDMERAFVMDCMECGACTFTCPSGVPIVHLIRISKSAIRDRRARER